MIYGAVLKGEYITMDQTVDALNMGMTGDGLGEGL